MKITSRFIRKLFDKPKVIGVISDVNEGKSMLLYNLIKKLKEFNVNLYTFGLRAEVNTNKIHSLEELEDLRDSIIIVDEFYNLFNLEDRKNVVQIERSLRLIAHNNNILMIVGTPDNFKKFISNKLSCIFYKKTTLGDFINGSRVKQICLNYRGYELGTALLNIPKNKALFYNGGYQMIDVEYLEEFDTKKENVNLLSVKNVLKNVQKKNTTKNVEKK